MSGYDVPADVAVSDTWWGHASRNPPSAEPGTDYATWYGTDLRMAWSGTVSVVDHSNSGGEGRRLSVDLDDGRRVSYLHLSAIHVGVGHRVERGQGGVCASGASGNGSDWAYGAHVHVSLWERPGMAYRDTIDFQLYTGPLDPPPPAPEGGPTMFLMNNASNPQQYMLVTADGGLLRARYLENPYERAVILAARPALPVAPCDDTTFNGFLAQVGYNYGQAIPLVDVNVADVSVPVTRGSVGIIALVSLLNLLGIGYLIAQLLL